MNSLSGTASSEFGSAMGAYVKYGPDLGKVRVYSLLIFYSM